MATSSKKLVLSKAEQRDVKKGLAVIKICGHCGKEVLYGGMMLIGLGISGHQPVCSYECNKALGQVQ